MFGRPTGGVIVIDEPELHLHKSIQNQLWSAIEKLRSDCVFVYLTHDIDFASAQSGATCVWLKSFDGASWEWDVVASDENLPDDLLLEVLGSRKPVVFVEGRNSSYDASLYREILPDFLVVPRGSCSDVIMSVKAFKANSQFHHLHIYGVIDRDRRCDEEVAALERESVFVLSVAEVENLFCVPEVIAIASGMLSRDMGADIQSVSDAVFKHFEQELDTQVSLWVSSEIKHRLSKFCQRGKGEEGLSCALEDLVRDIDVKGIYAESREKFEKIIANKDYEALLRVYNRKSLSIHVGGVLGLKNGELPALIVRLARGGHKNMICGALKKYFGKFADHISSV